MKSFNIQIFVLRTTQELGMLGAINQMCEILGLPPYSIGFTSVTRCSDNLHTFVYNNHVFYIVERIKSPQEVEVCNEVLDALGFPPIMSPSSVNVI
jgi:hypothetical protein